jgi:hypothetical protein
VPDQVSMVRKGLFSSHSAPKVQRHFRSQGACVIGIDDQLSICSTDLSFAPFHQWNMCIGNGTVGVDFDPLSKSFDNVETIEIPNNRRH